MNQSPIVSEPDPPARSTGMPIESWLISVIIHTLLLVLLGCCVFSSGTGRITHALQGRISTAPETTAEFPLSRLEEDFPTPAVETPVTETRPTDALVVELFDAETSSLAAAIDWASPATRSELSATLAARLQPATAMVTPLPRAVSSPSSSIYQADSIAAAVAILTNSIQDELGQGDTLVVWLLDASISLEAHRDEMAAQAREFYDKIERRRDTSSIVASNRLYSSVIGFGRQAQEICPPTTSGAKAIDAIRRVPRDSSGTENVLGAIDHALRLYRRTRQRSERLMLVVLTDEVGDDTLKLESSIRHCHDAEAVVHAITATSLLGIQQVIERCVIPIGGTNQTLWLDVNKGPESAQPQRFFLPYWHESTWLPWRPQHARRLADAPWYGGAYRERLLSGFPPYALTRLSLQTGGTITMFDHRHDEPGYYAWEQLRGYAPSYESLKSYRDAIRDSLLRQLVTEAAEMSDQYAELFVPPRMAFVANRAAAAPYAAQFPAVSPAEFRTRSELALRAERTRAEMARAKLMRLVQRYRDEQVDWQAEYQREESLRWRAWYDVTIGRLLSASVRYDEYLRALAQVNSSIDTSTNALMLLPSESLRGATSREQIDEAMFLLQRCLDANPSTPWAELARWELVQPWGIEIKPLRINAR